MKKVLIIAAVLGGIYFATASGKKTPTGTQTSTETDDVFVTYDNQVVKDSDGYWMLIKNGKVFNPESLTTLQAWQAANPTKPNVVELDFPVWVVYGNQNYGGTF